MAKKRQSPLEKFLGNLKDNESRVSTLLGALVVLAIGVLLFNYFKGINETFEPTDWEKEATEEVEGELGDSVVPDGGYVVQKGDTLWGLAERFYEDGFAWEKIAEANQLGAPYTIEVGQKLMIAEANSVGDQVATIEDEGYVVAEGDSLWQIAVRSYGDGYQWTKIAEANNLTNPGLIHPGNVLSLPRD